MPHIIIIEVKKKINAIGIISVKLTPRESAPITMGMRTRNGQPPTKSLVLTGSIELPDQVTTVP
ncbi:MAG TPA: hypothetical protein PLR50_06305, partial [Candidatus Rifleibacterium sp.]|nr:hypothetical protein [Candidatus Rifleibacterium sp.]